MPEADIPLTECLKDTVDRFLPYWHETIAPDIKAGKRVIIAAHGNSLRALVKYLDDLSEEEVLKLNIPTGMPLVYELDANLKPIKNYYLGDEEAVKAAMDAVANCGQGEVDAHEGRYPRCRQGHADEGSHGGDAQADVAGGRPADSRAYSHRPAGSGHSGVLPDHRWKAEVIESHFGDGSAFGVKINYVRQEVQDGTAKRRSWPKHLWARRRFC